MPNPKLIEFLNRPVTIGLHLPSLVFGILIGIIATPVLLIGGAFILSRILTHTP